MIAVKVLLHTLTHKHTKKHIPVYCVVIITLGFSPDPAPQLTGRQLGPHAVPQQGDSTPVAPSTSTPAPREQLV